MRPDDFKFIADLVRRRAGLVLTEDKGYLLDSRLKPLLRQLGLADFPQLVAELRAGREELIRDVTDALTTNETSFFRDLKPFTLLREIVLPHLLRHRAAHKRFRIWSAACSSGQEPYSLAMTLNEERARLQGWHWEIVATDLSAEVLNKAKQGTYSQFEVQRGMPTPLLLKYFAKSGESWQVKPEIRQSITFRPFNLLADAGSLGHFDVVFCRNVLIYFDPKTKAGVLERIGRQLADDGFLFLGGAETVIGVTDRFALEPGQRGVYRPHAGEVRDGVQPASRPARAASAR